ncbi:MAG: O-antigen ligase family protein, partial [Cycloclasticus sp.]
MFQTMPSIVGRSLGGLSSPWPIILFSLYSVYLSSAMTFPVLGKGAAGLLLLVGILGGYRLKRHFYVLTATEKWLGTSFILFSVVSIVSFFYWPQSRESRMHLEDYSTFMMLVPLYLLLRQFHFNVKCLVVLLSLAAISLGIYSLVQEFIFGIPRSGGAVNSMRYAGVSLVLASISLNVILAFRQKTLGFKILLMLAVCMGLIACLLTQVRGAWLVIPFLVVAYCAYLRRTFPPKFLYLMIIGAVVLTVSVSQMQVVQGRVQVTIDNFELYQQGDAQTSIGARLDMFKAAVILIKEKPVWGHGLHSYSPKATEIRQNTPGMSDQVGVWANPHNEILQVWVEKGFIGLVTLLLLFVVPAYLFIKALKISNEAVRFYAMSGLSILMVYAVLGQSVALFEHDVFNHFFALMVLLFASQIRVVEYMEDRIGLGGGLTSNVLADYRLGCSGLMNLDTNLGGKLPPSEFLKVVVAFIFTLPVTS